MQTVLSIKSNTCIQRCSLACVYLTIITITMCCSDDISFTAGSRVCFFLVPKRSQMCSHPLDFFEERWLKTIK